MPFRYFDSIFRFLEIRSGHHEFLAASVDGSLDDVFEIVFMALGAVILAPEYGVCEVDADLKSLLEEVVLGKTERGPTSMYFS
jgi:hypothetical protein